MVLHDTVYKWLKWTAMIALPAVATLYFALSQIWGFPYGEEVLGTISAVEVFLASLLGISSVNYKGDGEFLIDESDPDHDIFRLAVNQPLGDLSKKKTITLKVNPNASLKSINEEETQE